MEGEQEDEGDEEAEPIEESEETAAAEVGSSWQVPELNNFILIIFQEPVVEKGSPRRRRVRKD